MTNSPASDTLEDPCTPENEERKRFILHVVQPGLAGLMDGSVSTLAPLFAAAFATKVGLAAALGAGISMAFAEAMSDDGKMSGRGSPVARGLVCGGATTVGGLGHTLPYLINEFEVATIVAVAVVLVELLAISIIRRRYMDTPLLKALFGTMIGGLIVFGCGVLIGQS
jgi:erythrin-vacuolar iron transport family protein